MANYPGYPICNECSPGDTKCAPDGTYYSCEQGNCWMADGTCTPPVNPPIITIAASGCPVTVGNVFHVSGKLTTSTGVPIAGATVGIYSSVDGGAWAFVSNVTTASDGTYLLAITSSFSLWGQPGHQNFFYATYGGVNSVSAFCQYNPVPNVSTVMTASVSATSVAANGAMTIYGKLVDGSGNAVPGAQVRVLYAKPSCENPCVDYTVTTNSTGNWSITVSGADTSEAGTNSGWAVFLSQTLNGFTYSDSNMAYFDFTVTAYCASGVNPSTCYGTSACQYGIDTQYCDNGHLVMCEQKTDCLGCWVDHGSCTNPTSIDVSIVDANGLPITSVKQGSAAYVDMTLYVTGTTTPIAGMQLTLHITGPGGQSSASATTDANGKAAYILSTASMAVGTYTLYAQYAGNTPSGYADAMGLDVYPEYHAEAY